jgi:hypothetical protein
VFQKPVGSRCDTVGADGIEPPTAGVKPNLAVHRGSSGVMMSWNAPFRGGFLSTLSTDFRPVSTRLGTLLAQRGLAIACSDQPAPDWQWGRIRRTRTFARHDDDGATCPKQPTKHGDTNWSELLPCVTGDRRIARTDHRGSTCSTARTLALRSLSFARSSVAKVRRTRTSRSRLRVIPSSSGKSVDCTQRIAARLRSVHPPCASSAALSPSSAWTIWSAVVTR